MRSVVKQREGRCDGTDAPLKLHNNSTVFSVTKEKKPTRQTGRRIDRHRHSLETCIQTDRQTDRQTSYQLLQWPLLTRHHTMQLPSAEADTHCVPSLFIFNAFTAPRCSDREDTIACIGISGGAKEYQWECRCGCK